MIPKRVRKDNRSSEHYFDRGNSSGIDKGSSLLTLGVAIKLWGKILDYKGGSLEKSLLLNILSGRTR